MGRRRRNSDAEEIVKLKKQVRDLKREVKELNKVVTTFMREPRKALLAFFGITRPDEEVFTDGGLGVKYVEIVKDVTKKAKEEEFYEEIKEKLENAEEEASR